MKVAIAGASGLVGTALSAHLTAAGHEVTAIQRNPDLRAAAPFADVTPAFLEGFDGVINLAGENLAGKRWSPEQRRIIRESRTRTTAYLAANLGKTNNSPQVFINASAIGYYGDRGDDLMTEQSPPGSGFLPALCKDWERATEPAARAGLRIVMARLGVVLSKEGGALKKMLLPFQLGAGGIMGTGRQCMSWISINDVVRAFEFLLTNDGMKGPVNVVAPNPVTNAQFTKALGEELHKPTVLPAPAYILTWILGDMAQEMLLEGCRVLPEKLQTNGFKFRYPDLDMALKKELDKPAK